MKKRSIRTYDKEFKENAISLYYDGNKNFRRLAEDLGIPSGTLSYWVREKEKSGSDAFSGKGYLKPQDTHIKNLERELEKTKRERDILKKALAIFSSL